MAMERGITVFFMDGSKMSLNFPRQVSSEEDIPLRVEKLPAPSNLPVYVVRGASIPS